MINNLTNCNTNCNVFSVYDYDGLSLQELLCQFFTTINACVDDVNEYTKIVNDTVAWIKNQGVKEAVIEKIKEMKDSGEFDQIIKDEIFTDFETRLQAVTVQSDHNVQRIDALDQRVTQEVSDMQKHLEDELTEAKEFVNGRVEIQESLPFLSGSGHNPWNSKAFRIPWMTVTKRGTIIAGCDIRHNSPEDHSYIEQGSCRSEDGGKTWKDYTVAMENTKQDMSYSRAMDGTVIYDEARDRIWLLANLWNKNQAWTQSTIHKDPDWDIRLSYSDDDGKTWRVQQTNLRDICPPEASQYIGGVGSGIVWNGKLIFPVQISYTSKNPANLAVRASYIYSTDGATWVMGPAVPAWSSECNVYVEDNKLKMNARCDATRAIVMYESDGIGSEWRVDKVGMNTFIGARGTMGSTISIPELDMVLFTNPADPNGGRADLSVWVKDSNNLGFNKALLLNPSGLGYACLAYDKWNRRLYALYEGWSNIHFKEITSEILSLRMKQNVLLDADITNNYGKYYSVTVDSINGSDVYNYAGSDARPYKTIAFAIKDILRRPDLSLIKNVVIKLNNHAIDEKLMISNLPFKLKIERGWIYSVEKPRAEIKGMYVINSNVELISIRLKKHKELGYPLACEDNTTINLSSCDIVMDDVDGSKPAINLLSNSSLIANTLKITGNAQGKKIFNVTGVSNITLTTSTINVENIGTNMLVTDKHPVSFSIVTPTIVNQDGIEKNLLKSLDFSWSTTAGLRFSTSESVTVTMDEEGKTIFESGAQGFNLSLRVQDSMVTLSKYTLRVKSAGLNSGNANNKKLFTLPKALKPLSDIITNVIVPSYTGNVSIPRVEIKSNLSIMLYLEGSGTISGPANTYLQTMYRLW